MTERLPFNFSLSCTGEGNGNPLQCSCLENPRDGGAWWASVYGVAQSQTRLKRLSSSSSSSSVCVTRVWLFATPWTIARQAPLSMKFSRQDYWSGLPFLSPGDLPDPGIEPRSPAVQADSLYCLSHQQSPRKTRFYPHTQWVFYTRGTEVAKWVLLF